MPARVVVFGGDSISCINTELNTVGTLVPPLTVCPRPSIFQFSSLIFWVGKTQSLGNGSLGPFWEGLTT